jgi:N6-L-threonylcarbamoyladenine synthase
MIVLGIESSCDETAVGIVEDGKTLLANAVFSSMDLHKAYGGVVPEIAARSHIESIVPVIKEALETAFPTVSEVDAWDNIDAVAVTYGAGLGGSLLVGVMAARTVAIAKKKPLYAINHVEAHVYANFLTQTSLPGYRLPSTSPQFPVLALIVSGGHTQLALFEDHFTYTLLGQTRDDAIGEAFDKVAKIIGLPYPGGPSVAEAAKSGDPYKYKLPKSKLDHVYEFSFSGVKTAVLRLAQEQIGEDFTFPSYKVPERLSEAQKNDIAASFQRVAIETVVDKAVLAYDEFQPRSVVIAGGVAASSELRRQLSERMPIDIQYTDMKLCTDNGAMIATLGCYKAMLNQPTADPYSLSIAPNLSM